MLDIELKVYATRHNRILKRGACSWYAIEVLCKGVCRTKNKLVALHGRAGRWSRLAPFRILSVDIECAGRKVHIQAVT